MPTLAHRTGKITSIIYQPEHEGLLQNRNYKLIEVPFRGMLLEDYDAFVLPKKIYGEVSQITNRILNTFVSCKKNVGVLLTGLKGTGKSLQLKHIASSIDMPVIIIDQAYDCGSLLDFINKLPQSCVIVIDEFEKVFREKEDQEGFLPILDGLSTKEHIFVLTCNEEVSEYMMARPSRIRYCIRYHGLARNIVEEIVKDELHNQEKLEEVVDVLTSYNDLNIDTVLSLVSEVNIYPHDTIENIIKIFNLPNPFEGDFDFIIKVPCLVFSDSAQLAISDIADYEKQIKKYISAKYSTLSQNYWYNNAIDPKSHEEIQNMLLDITNQFPHTEIKLATYKTTSDIESIRSNGLEDLLHNRHFSSDVFTTERILVGPRFGSYWDWSRLGEEYDASLFKIKPYKSTIHIVYNDQTIYVGERQVSFLRD